MSYSLGIDLGTTYSAAAVSRFGKVEIVSLGNDRAAIPSVVLIREDGTVLTGEAASRRAITEPELVSREFKRRLGDPTPLLIGGAAYSAESLMARLLSSILDDVRNREGGDPDHITISHPANWGQYKIGLLEQALQLAGLTEASLISEPEAAAISYAHDNRLKAGQIIAVYDLGGGTFDTAVLKKTEDGFEILGTPVGIERLGGIDFDAAVFGHVVSSLEESFSELDEDDPQAVASVSRIRRECTAAREALSRDTDVSIPVHLPNATAEVRLTRGELESMIRPGLSDSVNALHQALASAGVEASDLHTVLLVGGTSRTPLVSQLLGAEVGRPVSVDADPKHAIAIGAAQYASMQEPTEQVAASIDVSPANEPVDQPADEPAAQPAAAETPPEDPIDATPTPTEFVPSAPQGVAAVAKSLDIRIIAVAAVAVLVIAAGVFMFTRSGSDDDAANPASSSDQPVDPRGTSTPEDSTDDLPSDVSTDSGEIVQTTVDAGSVVLINATNPTIGSDDFQSQLSPAEYAPLTQLEGQVFGYLDVAPATNQQFYDYATFTTTTPGLNPTAVWAALVPEAWQSLSSGVPETFDALGLSGSSPVAGLSFDAAEGYCAYALKRLPTEIEWELAAGGGLIGVGEVQNWVASPESYGEVPDGSRVLRGSFGIEELPLYFRTIGDSPTNRLNAGVRCAADDVIEASRPSGELLYLREFSGADEAHDWPDLHDPNNPEVAFGYHAPDVFHIELRSPLQVAVTSGQILGDDVLVGVDVELRQPDQPVGGFAYGLIANADGVSSLIFTVQDQLAADGQRSLLWCVRHDSEGLVVAGFTQSLSSACELEGLLDVSGSRNRIAIGFANGEATFYIGDVEVAAIAETVVQEGTFGFLVQNTEPSLLSHSHFDNLAIVRF